MNLKSYIRRGLLNESHSYRQILTMDHPSKYIVLILEGKGRRKLRLTKNRVLYESYFPNTFIGVEDLMLGTLRSGEVYVFPATHYLLWEKEDFISQLSIYPNLAKIVISSLSKRIRLYDQKQKKIDISLIHDLEIENTYDSMISDDELYHISFSEQGEIPQDILAKYSQSFLEGEYIIKTGETTQDLFIILNGSASVYIDSEDSNETPIREKIDTVETGDMIGEMSLFDNMPRSADIIADTKLLTLKLNPENFNVIFNLHPKWSLKIIDSLCARVEARRKSLESIDISLIH